MIERTASFSKLRLYCVEVAGFQLCTLCSKSISLSIGYSILFISRLLKSHQRRKYEIEINIDRSQVVKMPYKSASYGGYGAS